MKWKHRFSKTSKERRNSQGTSKLPFPWANHTYYGPATREHHLLNNCSLQPEQWHTFSVNWTLNFIEDESVMQEK